jgi:hypothetical protein
MVLVGRYMAAYMASDTKSADVILEQQKLSSECGFSRMTIDSHQNRHKAPREEVTCKG